MSPLKPRGYDRACALSVRRPFHRQELNHCEVRINQSVYKGDPKGGNGNPADEFGNDLIFG